jgi:hypothetical protein
MALNSHVRGITDAFTLLGWSSMNGLAGRKPRFRVKASGISIYRRSRCGAVAFKDSLVGVIGRSGVLLADENQFVDRIARQVAVNDGTHHQLVQRNRPFVIVEKRRVGGVATGGDTHQRLPRR